MFFQFSHPLFFVCFFLLLCFYSSNPFAFPFLFFLFSFYFFSLSLILLFFLFYVLSSLSFCSLIFFSTPLVLKQCPSVFHSPLSLCFFFKIFLSLNTSHQNLSLPKPPIVSLFSSGIYKQEEREPPCPVQSWLKVWHGVTSVQQPKSRSQGMAPLSFLHHSGRACGGMGYARVWANGEGGREGGKAGEKTSSSPAMCLGKKKRSVVQNGTVLCFCLLL